MSRSARFSMFALALLGMVLLPRTMFAHEQRRIGRYEFVVGFSNEPAFKEQQNAVDLRVTNTDTDQPVEKLNDSLKVQLIMGSEQRELALKPVWNQPGAYKAVFFPTAAGDYTFRFFGTIEGSAIDEQFTSKPGGFNPVQEPAELHFPTRLSTTGDLDAKIATLQASVQRASMLSSAGMGSGVLGLIVAVVALRGRKRAETVAAPAVARTVS